MWRHPKKDTLAELTWAGSSCPRVVTHSSERESKAVSDLLERLPLAPVSLAADTGYSEDSLHELLEKRSITAYIPIHTKQQNSMVAKSDFVYQGDHLVYPQGKVLCRSAFDQRTGTYQYVARKRDRQAAPSRTPVFRLTMYHPLYLRARERNRTAAYRREGRRRQTIAEGTFASLGRLGWEKSRLRGLWKVDCEWYIAALAHNVLKMVRRMGRGIGPPGSRGARRRY